jgi:hypothetical protein
MKKNLFIFIIVIFSALSCVKKSDDGKKNTRPSDVVPVEKMTKVMEDVMLAEGAISLSETKHQHADYYTLHYYNYVLKKNNISGDQFRKSYNYYASDIEEMLKIMTTVIDSLSQEQSRIRKK